MLPGNMKKSHGRGLVRGRGEGEEGGGGREAGGRDKCGFGERERGTGRGT